MFLLCFWYVFSVFNVFSVCFWCVFRKNALFRAQREENVFSVIVCFQYMFSVFSVCFRFFGFSVLSARKSVYLKSGLAAPPESLCT